MRQFKFNISSWKNVRFAYSEIFTLEDMGLDEEEWTEMSERDRDQAIEDYGVQLRDKYVDWSAGEIES